MNTDEGQHPHVVVDTVLFGAVAAAMAVDGDGEESNHCSPYFDSHHYHHHHEDYVLMPKDMW
jgi:hypothetical protein